MNQVSSKDHKTIYLFLRNCQGDRAVKEKSYELAPQLWQTPLHLTNTVNKQHHLRFFFSYSIWADTQRNCTDMQENTPKCCCETHSIKRMHRCRVSDILKQHFGSFFILQVPRNSPVGVQVSIVNVSLLYEVISLLSKVHLK